MEHSLRDTGPAPRRGPSVDLDPHGSVTGTRPTRQHNGPHRQFLNDSLSLSQVYSFLALQRRSHNRMQGAGESVELLAGQVSEVR